MSSPIWKGRLSTALDKDFSSFQASLKFDVRLARYDILASIAHTEMLQEQGILTLEDAGTILAALQEIHDQNEWTDVRYAEMLGEDIHSTIESVLRAKIGSLAGKLHTARSRNDQVATDLRLFVKDACKNHISGIKALRVALLALAEHHLTSRLGKPAVIPGYTHLQAAQPLHLSHWYMSYYEALGRDQNRFQDACLRMDECPLGAAALGGTSWPVNRFSTSKKLGFRGPMKNSIDAVSSRDFVTDYLHASASLVTTLSRMSEDLIIYSTSEFGFVSMPDEFATGSSIMPQKKNPDLCELTRAKTGRVCGHLLGMFVVLKALPTAYNRDLQEDKEAVFDVFDTVEPLLVLWERLIPKLTWNVERMFDKASEGFSAATELADKLTQAGLAFRDAYKVIGRLVAYCIEHHRTFEDLSASELREFHPALTQDLLAQITVEKILEQRRSFGGSGHQIVMDAVLEAKRSLHRGE